MHSILLPSRREQQRFGLAQTFSYNHPFEFQHPFFEMEAISSAEAAKGASGDNTVAGNDDGEAVFGHHAADGAGGTGLPAATASSPYVRTRPRWMRRQARMTRL